MRLIVFQVFQTTAVYDEEYRVRNETWSILLPLNFHSASCEDRIKTDGFSKKSENILFCHSREGGNPGFSGTFGLPPSREWRLMGLFTSSSRLG